MFCNFPQGDPGEGMILNTTFCHNIQPDLELREIPCMDMKFEDLDLVPAAGDLPAAAGVVADSPEYTEVAVYRRSLQRPHQQTSCHCFVDGREM